MISKKKRITSKTFKEKYPISKKKYTKHFRISIYQENSANKTRVAIITSKKALKKAVLRHKNKRIIYNIVRQYYPQIQNDLIVFIHILKDISNIDKNILKDEILSILAKK